MHKTFFNQRHRALNATMVDFGGWDMPVQYPKGVIREHLACPKPFINLSKHRKRIHDT